jgi:ribonuclease G
MGSREKIQSLALPVQEGQILEVTVEETHISNSKDGIARIEGYVVNIENAGDMVGKRVKIQIYKTFRTYSKARMI